MAIFNIPELGDTEINIGDRIKFKSATRDGNRAAWRKVTGFWNYGPLYKGEPTVTYKGWSDFLVHPFEILEVE